MTNPYTQISFPFFGIEIDPGRAISLGPVSIHYYGIAIALGLILAVMYGWWRRKEFGISEDDLTDGVLWIVPFSIVCARLYYCAFSWDTYKDDPISMLYIWNGGLAIYGGVIGAGLGVVIHCAWRKIKLPAILDLVALGFLIGQCVGRWGNFFNREAFGGETDVFIKMGLLNSVTGKVEYHHPTFLYESLWNFVGFLALHFLTKRRQYDGQIALGYVAWYGLGRTIIEGLRTDSLYWGPFRVSQLLAAASCLIATAVLLILALKPHDRAKLYKNQLEALATAAEEAAAEEPVAEEAPAEEIPAEEAVAEETVAETEEQTPEE